MKNQASYFFSSEIIAALLLLASTSAFAQFPDSVKAYGAVVSRISTLRNTTAITIGGRGGWIIDHTYGIGIGGYMLANNVDARKPDTSGNHWMTLSYGGVDLEYVSAINDSYFLTLQALIGAGSISHEEIPYLDRRQYHDPFFVFEPGVGIEIGVTKIFRIGIGASYRQVAWLKSNLASSADVSGPSAFLSLKVGFL
jgi:hypothetical protein